MQEPSRLCQKSSFSASFLSVALAVLFLMLGVSQRAEALPAFARKYGLRCSACHESWPMLNYFGQKFKDNGYQLMNDRDAPIWQNASYWPITLRITPFWSRESTNKVAVDSAPTGEQRLHDRIQPEWTRHPHRRHFGKEHFLPAGAFFG